MNFYSDVSLGTTALLLRTTSETMHKNCLQQLSGVGHTRNKTFNIKDCDINNKLLTRNEKDEISQSQPNLTHKLHESILHLKPEINATNKNNILSTEVVAIDKQRHTEIK